MSSTLWKEIHMTRAKKITITVSTVLILAIAATLLIFSALHFGQPVVPGFGGNKVGVQAQVPITDPSGRLLTDCPGCSPWPPH
jgi:hypothetical protein